MTKKLAYVTNIPTPYRDFRFRILSDCLLEHGIELEVLYMAHSEPGRYWDSSKLRYGYKSKVYKNFGFNVGSKRFFHFNPGLVYDLYVKRYDYVIIGGVASPSHILSALFAKSKNKIMSVESNVHNIRPNYLRDRHMENFKIEKDDDGIVLATFDMPGRSMNVLSASSMAEIAELVDMLKTDESVKGMVITGIQVVVGAVIGFVTLMVMQIMVMGGSIIAMQSSLGFAAMVDPVSGQQTPVVAQLFLMLSTLLFFSLDGHLWMLQMLHMSSFLIPVGVDGITWPNFHVVAAFGSTLFAGGLSMAIAEVIALLMINITFGYMTRAAPQLNIFTIGFPIIMVSGLLFLWVTASNLLDHFLTAWRAAVVVFALGNGFGVGATARVATLSALGLW